ncbi:CaiB/BaiF CoA transferase family protein [Kushneria marisflavi]|uniref:Formyl-CoA transferase n=1 Tax=Kushneria marisflavi TaxID=157779 RepID=A0A240UPM4_9GAMM|nr:CaiB/BaiF CoA-transferase family protein [Kushneria marisflavi]ART63023.1 formyl-CoA transferase [Kushneria marisflavi]RKD84734.1 crotonobetainyl-CoA:carnitine CoA-transferase CaiB-like acyl-CoA transferase [Kushneria marisflavi]
MTASDATAGIDAPGALAGLKVLEMGQLIAGPFATKLLGEFGADVIKIEPPGTGDPLRRWRIVEEGTSLWWHVQTRNKRSLSLDLRSEEGQEIVRQLALEADIVVENFRPGTLEKWGLGWETLSAANPGLIMVRISGYGQTGPYRDRPGFGVIGEAMGGLRYLSGHPGERSVRVGVSLGDSLSALYGVIGALLALQERHKSGQGQYIDVALYESVFAMMESLIPEYDGADVIREPSGSALPGITPSNSYPCLNDEHVLIAGNGDSIYQRLMQAIERPDLAEDPALAHNDGRSRQAERIDGAIAEWTSRHERDHVLSVLESVGVPVGFPYTARDIVNDPHYQARDMIQTIITSEGRKLKVPGVMPRLSRTPGRIEGGGPRLGQHTRDVLDELGIDADTQQALFERGVLYDTQEPDAKAPTSGHRQGSK